MVYLGVEEHMYLLTPEFFGNHGRQEAHRPSHAQMIAFLGKIKGNLGVE